MIKVGFRHANDEKTQRARTTRTAGLVLGLTLTAALTGCGAKTVQVSGQKGQLSASSTADPKADGSGAADQVTAGFVFPDPAPIVIPDVTSFTERSQQYAEKLGALAQPGSGVLVAGARCDPKGRVVNTPQPDRGRQRRRFRGLRRPGQDGDQQTGMARAASWTV